MTLVLVLQISSGDIFPFVDLVDPLLPFFALPDFLDQSWQSLNLSLSFPFPFPFPLPLPSIIKDLLTRHDVQISGCKPCHQRCQRSQAKRMVFPDRRGL